MEKVSFFGNAFKYSLIISIFTIVLSLIYYILGVEIFNYGFIAGNLIIGLLILVGCFLFGIKNYRNSLGGKISFGKAFLQGLAIGLLAYIVIAIYNYGFYAFIAPEYAEVQLEGLINFMEGFGANIPDEAFDEAIDKFEDQMTPIGMFKSQLMNGSIMSLIISLIVAASIKKDTTQSEIV